MLYVETLSSEKKSVTNCFFLLKLFTKSTALFSGASFNLKLKISFKKKENHDSTSDADSFWKSLIVRCKASSGEVKLVPRVKNDVEFEFTKIFDHFPVILLQN